MAKFFAIVDNNYDYIHEVFATTKQMAYQQLSENVPPESITALYSEEEFASLSNGNQIPSGGEAIEQPLDFNALIAQTTQDAIRREGNINSQLNYPQIECKNQKSENKNDCSTQNVQQKTLLESATFSDNGMTYKIENGIVYKKTWRDLSEEEIPEFKIVSNTTNKDVPDNGKYKIQRLDWTPINN